MVRDITSRGISFFGVLGCSSVNLVGGTLPAISIRVPDLDHK